ncbi:NADH dehydrogenase [ubiquinone] 1 subunit C2 [Frankliniella fusca]|uniref:NADH dehydrogenase [ubiquinone] 1 subunit C2 n=1 Tax=Frankliniella fusca TaxID=407009 RepID=A0AAE1H4I7_9NEOP|nr:NADH dehydrogenase [ubiquinone] 1 subunit C2 [Frankliniella fusca]
MAYVDFPIKSDLDRLAYDEYRQKKSLFSETWIPAAGGILGYMSITFRNFHHNKPMFTGIWRCLITVPIGVAAGLFLRDRQREKSRVKWAAHQHYIELHPEDFPPYPPPVKVGDTLEPWYPMRNGW